jgi:hypothetical protein
MTIMRVPPGRDVRDLLSRYDYLILFILFFLAYTTVSNINFPSGDVAPASFLPESIILHQNLNFDNAPAILSDRDFAYAFLTIQGHRVSFFPIVTGVIVMPVYAASHLLAAALSAPLGLTEVFILAKLSAALIAAAAGTVMYLVARQLFSRQTALATALIFTFATSTWSISSQALWQTGPVEFFLLLSCWLVMKNEDCGWRGYGVLLGIVSGLCLFTRPPEALLLLPVALWMVWRHRRQLPGYAAGAVLGGAPFFWYNWSVFGTFFGGYTANIGAFVLSPDFISAYIALLVAPNVGLLVFCPVLVLSVFGYLIVYRDSARPLRSFFLLLMPAVFLQILLYSFLWFWHSSSCYCYGPRYLTCCIPYLCLYTGFFIGGYFGRGPGTAGVTGGRWKRQLVALVVWELVAVSVLIQFIGVFLYPGYMAKTMDEERVWDLSDSIIVQSFVWGGYNIEGIELLAPPPLRPLMLVRFSPVNVGTG